jgi:DNA-binding GntR family transcriptional regulator
VTDDPRRYMRVAAELRASISAGRFGPGDKLPPIGKLVRDRNVSRQTAGKGLQVLADEGLIQRVPGLGYFVLEAPNSANGGES